MNRQFPDHLITRFQQLADDFEAYIRADERDRIISKMRGNLFTEQTRPLVERTRAIYRNAAVQESDQQQESGPQPVTYDPAAAFDYAGQGLNETHRRLIARLAEGTFYAVPTLAGHLNIKKQSVYHYLSGIQKAGYQLEIRSTGNRKGGYVNIYRLAKTG